MARGYLELIMILPCYHNKDCNAGRSIEYPVWHIKGNPIGEFKQYLAEAKKGNTDSMVYLAICYDEGIGV